MVGIFEIGADVFDGKNRCDIRWLARVIEIRPRSSWDEIRQLVVYWLAMAEIASVEPIRPIIDPCGRIRLIRALIACSLVVVTFANTVQAQNQPVTTAITASSLAPDRLRCEYLPDPLGIDVSGPRLTWTLATTKPGSRGLSQTGYQILVASTAQLLAQDKGDIWNSTKVLSNHSAQIQYEGKPLRSEATCYWKVRVWDQDGIASGWSDSALWSMGLMTQGDWQAKWIGRDDAKPSVPPDGIKIYLPATYLRKEFKVTKPLTRAVLYVTGQGLVEPWLNGDKVGEDYFIPGWTDYHKRLYYRTYDVTSEIKPGANALGAILGDGWFRGNVSILGQSRYGKKTRLLAQLHLFYQDGSTDLVVSDESWKAAFGPILQDDNYAGETYDARLEIPNWCKPGFDDTAWQSTSLGAEINPQLCAYPEAPVRRQGEIIPTEITQPKPGSYVFNMGQNFAGWVRLRVNAPAGTTIVMGFGELKKPDGTVFRANLRSALATDTYICKGAGEEVWEPRFTYHGFQYVEVDGLPSAPDTHTLTGIIVHSSVPPVGDFECSDSVMTQTRRNMSWTIASNSFDVPTDCCQRDERMGWMDYHEVARSALWEFDSSSLLTKWMADIDDAQLSPGAFSCISPDVHRMGWSPGWADSVALVPWMMYEVYGDTMLAEKYYPDLVANVAYYQSRSKDLIGPDTGFGDWLSLEKTPKSLMSTAFFAHDTEVLSKLATALGKTGDAQKYQALFEQIRAAFQRKFVAPDGTVGSNSQGSYAFAIAYDLLTDQQRVLAGNKLADVIQKAGCHITTGMPTTHLLLTALTETGHSDTARQMFTVQTLPSWGYFLHMGATSIWERWDSLTEKGLNKGAMNSFDHGNLGTCTEWFYPAILGIDTDEPGFQNIVMKPQFGCGITWAKGYYDSIHGRISSSWKEDSGSLTWDISIPVNTCAQVYIPAAPSEVKEGSIPATERPGIKFLRMENGASVFDVGSGSYHFTISHIK